MTIDQGNHLAVISLIIIIANKQFLPMDKELKITSFNCNGYKGKNHKYVSEVFKACDILFLQETWLYSFEHKKYTQNIPSCQYHAVSAMDDSDVGRVGRPYGGCAILWHHDLAVAFSPINTSSQRICAIMAKAKEVNIVLINVYMPNDDNKDVNFEIYGEILAEISQIINMYVGYDVILGGDFNVDFKRINSRNLNLLKQFLNDEQVVCLTQNLSDDHYTFENSLGSRSFIDHFIVNSRLVNCSVEVAYDGDNLSDHKPISIKTCIQTKLSYSKYCNKYIIDWNNATETNIVNYKNLLNHYIDKFHIAFSVITCNDFLCKIHDDYILDKLNEFIDILHFCALSTIPTKYVKQKKGIPGWNEFVQPFKDKSIFWNDIWKNVGSPKTGQIAQERKSARYKYHWAIKQVKKDADKIILNKTAQQLSSRSFSEFWKTIKKLKGTEYLAASVIDGECSDQAIVNKFQCIYDKLYNSITDVEFKDVIEQVNNLVADSCNKNCCESANCHNISVEVLIKTIKSLNSGKDDEVYDLTTDHFINASDKTIAMFCKILNSCLTHGTTNISINKSVIKPIPKNKRKLLADLNNYRAISKNTIISKIIDNILIHLIGEKIDSSVYQFAYKQGFSTSMCSFLVSETIQYYRSHGSNVYMLSLDCTKAFDLVQHTKLFQLLISRCVCPLLIRLLINIYAMSTAVVKWNNCYSENFTIKNGVKQGAIISAPLFALYVEPMLKRLNKTKVGCYIGNLCANAFAYADDLVILSPSCAALRTMITVCESYANDYKLKFNPEKCTLLIFSDSEFYNNNVNITLCGYRIKNVKSETHLGHQFCSSYDQTYNMINFDSIIRDIKIRTNTIVNEFRPVSWQSKVTLFLSQCSSLYGCPLWRLDDPKVEELHIAWKVCSRRILGLHYRARSRLLHQLMNTMPILYTIKYIMLSFFLNGLNHADDFISRFYTNTLLSNSSFMLCNVNKILKEFDIKYIELFNMTKLNLKHIFKSKISKPDWQCNMIIELLQIRDSQFSSILSNEELKVMLDKISTDFLGS